MSKKSKKYLLPWELKKKYGFTTALIKKYLGSPDGFVYVKGRSVPVQLRTKVEAVLKLPEFIADRQRIQEENNLMPGQTRKRKKPKTPGEYLSSFDVSGYVETAKQYKRHFVIHYGPTNSGKTYDAIEALKCAEKGIYLGPLRLLALEVFDKLNASGKPCSLLTGEEFIDIPFSGITASTIEMCDYEKHYDVAVIDEAQLISANDRGGHWLSAILRLNADVIHICTATEALNILKRLLESFAAPYETVYHERLTPLVFSGSFPMNKYDTAMPGDAFIVFSRKAVLAVAAELEKAGIKASVIYGSLPPQTRRKEVKKLSEGSTSVVVATDAIGMGVSLPIKRIIFCQTEKFDGTSYRGLTDSEIKQIAGRAGRYGIYDVGEVLTMENEGRIRSAVDLPAEEIKDIVVPFPKEAADGKFSLIALLASWQKLPKEKGFIREDMSRAIILYKLLAKDIGHGITNFSKSCLLRYISCPVDTNSNELVRYWLNITEAILFEYPRLPEPPIITDTLENCETSYKALDIEQQMFLRMGERKNNESKKAQVEKQINALLEEDKSEMNRKCICCHRPLPPLSRYNFCEKCSREIRTYHRK